MVLFRNFFLLFLLFSRELRADQKPFAYIRNFLPEETGAHPQNWKVIQDKKGFIYSGNHEGILVFDGVKWELNNTKNFSDVKYLHYDTVHQIIYYGGVGEFGEFCTNQRGAFFFKPYHLDSSVFKEPFADIWKIHQIGQDVFFQSFAAIFKLSKGKLKAIMPEKEFHLSFKAGNNILVQEPSAGLKMIKGENAVLLKGGEYFKGDKIYSILPLTNDDYQLVSRKYGLLKVKILQDVISLSKESCLNNLPSDIYCGYKMSDTLFAYGSLSEGLFLVKASGAIHEVFNSRNGLLNESIKDIFVDSQKGIWLALQSGISRIDDVFPIRFFSGVSGVSASVQSIANFDNSLFLATSQGIFRSHRPGSNESGPSFTELPGVKNQVFQLLRLNNQSLLASGIDGIFCIESGGISKIADYRSFSLALAPWDSTILMIGCFDGLSMLRQRNGAWLDQGYVNNEEVQIRRMAFDESGNLWYSAADTTIKKISRKDLQSFSIEGGVIKGTTYNPRSRSDNSFSIQPFFVSGKLLVGGHGKIYTYDVGKDALMPFMPEVFNSFLGEGEVYRIFEENSRLWIWQNNPGNHLLAYLNTKHPEKGPVSQVFSILKSKVVHDIACDKHGNILFGTSEGLYFYDPRQQFPVRPYPAVLQEVILNNRDTLLLNYAGESKLTAPEIAFGQNTLSFSFSALFFSSPEQTRFSSRLIGYDSTFTPWAPENTRSFTNLPEGNYVFEVKAINIVGKESQTVRFAFSILPPWYRTAWAYAGYVLCTVLLTLGVVRISVYRLTKAKKRLELLVKSRTSEVVRQKEEVEKQKHLVELRNKDITDSINYARRIQHAILPVKEEIRAALPDGFILFLPRDIVSGDFFWFSGKYRSSHHYIFLAAVDCTGHGVPGAFMSMIGNTLLNEIVNEKGILEPELILGALNEAVRKALKQNNEDTGSRDGMDLALLRLNMQTGTVQYAGANRPLWIYRKNGTFEDHKPDKMAIGGLQNTSTKIFNTKMVELSPGDRLFVFTDGYADQFGGADGKKFMVKKFQQTLASLHEKPLVGLDDILLDIHRQWKGNHEQVDDILVMGFSLPEKMA